MRIKDFIDYEQPNEYIVESDRYSSKYSTPVLTAGQFFILGYTNESKGIYKKGPCIIFDDFTTSVHYVDFPFKVKSSAMKILTTKSIADLKYCYYLLLSLSKMPPNHKRQWISTTSEKNHLLPSIDKQISIVKQLDLISDTIAYYSKQIEHLDNLVKARFVEMFGDENNSKCWDIMHVEDVADVQVGVVIKPAQYYTNECKRIKAFRSLNIGEGYIKNSDWVYFSEDGNKKNNKSILKENDILIVRSGAPGTSCVVTKEYEGCNAIDIIIARPNCEKINPYYLCTFTNMPHGKKQIVEGTGGAAQQHFNVGKYNKLQLMLPPKDLQFKFEQFLKQVDKSKFHCFHQKIRETFQVSQKLTFLLKFYSTCVLWYKVIQYATSIFRQRLLIHIQEGNEYHHLISSYIVP